MQQIQEFLDLNTINIVLCRASTLLALVQLHQTEKENKEIENNLLILPYGTYHHTNYEYHFKGACVENLNPIIVTQNKEFLNVCINTPEDILGVVSYDFNIVQLSYNQEKEEFTTNIITKKEAQKLLQENPDLELRDF